MVLTARRPVDVELRELSGESHRDIESFRRFYTECYERAFPDADERESLANMERYLGLKEQDWYGPNNYHIVIATRGDEVVGAAVCDYLAEPNAGVIEYLLVRPKYQASGLGEKLFAEIERLCRADAARTDGRDLDWIVTETKDPLRAGAADDFHAFTRAEDLARLGFRIIDFRYIQPALSESQASAENLLLLARAVNGSPDTIEARVVSNLVAEYLRWAMRIDDPASRPEYRRMTRALAWRDSVKLIEFGDYLGWDPQGKLRIVDVRNVRDPELAAATRVYDTVYTDAETAWPSDIFRSAVKQRAKFAKAGYFYHLWALHHPADGPCDGMGAFLVTPTAGYSGYMAFEAPLRGSGLMRKINPRMEETLIRDNPNARGWYTECHEEVNVVISARLQFWELDVVYEQPVMPDDPDAKPVRLHLLYKSFGRHYEPPVVPREEFLRATAEIYQVVYGVDPTTNPSYRVLVESLGDSETVSAVNVGSEVEVDTGDGRVVIKVDELFDESHPDGAGFAGTPVTDPASGDDAPAGRIVGCMEQIVRLVRLTHAW